MFPEFKCFWFIDSDFSLFDSKIACDHWKNSDLYISAYSKAMLEPMIPFHQVSCEILPELFTAKSDHLSRSQAYKWGMAEARSSRTGTSFAVQALNYSRTQVSKVFFCEYSSHSARTRVDNRNVSVRLFRNLGLCKKMLGWKMHVRKPRFWFKRRSQWYKACICPRPPNIIIRC
jgi:hypothetical protein